MQSLAVCPLEGFMDLFVLIETSSGIKYSVNLAMNPKQLNHAIYDSQETILNANSHFIITNGVEITTGNLYYVIRDSAANTSAA